MNKLFRNNDMLFTARLILPRYIYINIYIYIYIYIYIEREREKERERQTDRQGKREIEAFMV